MGALHLHAAFDGISNAPDAIGKTTQKAEIMGNAAANPPTILVVDDEDLLREMLRDFFVKEGYDAISAENYAGALDLLDRFEVDLILADIRMPGKSGVDLLETIKSLGLDAPVIMITGQPDIETAADALRLGAFDYVVKPFQFKSFLPVIEKALRHKALLDAKRRLETENQVYREHLEAMVGARTAQLEKANESLRREIDRRITAQKLMRIQRDLGIRLNGAADAKTAAAYAFDALFEIDDIDGAALCAREDGSGNPFLLHHAGLNDAFIRAVSCCKPGEGKTPAVFRDAPVYGAPSVVFETPSFGGHDDMPAWTGILPLRHENRTVAALIVASEKPRRLSSHTVHGLEVIASQLGGVIARINAEKAARIKHKQLVQADKMKSLGILVAGMAHEISNPNNFIMLNIPLLSDSWRDALPILDRHRRSHGDFRLANIPFSEMRDHIPELLDAIGDGARRIKKIVSSLKEYARGGPADLTEDVNLNDVLEEALLLMSNPLKKATDRLTIDRDPALPAVRGSFHQLEQVLINLIQNACQALTDRDQPIEIATRHETAAGAITVQIRDGGPGIQTDHLDCIFDPFFTTKRAAGGCGLGLSICAGIVKEHGGAIRFESEPGQGTTVSLEFPARTV